MGVPLQEARASADSRDVTLSRSRAGPCGAALLVWLTGAAAVQGQQYSFRYYGAEDGLTNLAVKVLFQDRTGFLWAATFLSIGYFLGERWKAVEGEIHRYAVLFTIIAAALLAVYLIWRWLMRRKESSTQRR